MQELADFALTRYYRVLEDRGIGPMWLGLSESLRADQAEALLGVAFGPAGQLFDPGRLGAYFQSPEMVRRSLVVLSELTFGALRPFGELLTGCADRQLGVYVTF